MSVKVRVFFNDVSSDLEITLTPQSDLKYWLVDSIKNRSFIEKLWKMNPTLRQTETLTLFKMGKNDDLYTSLLRVMDLIDLHYNELSSAGRWYEIVVYGCAADLQKEKIEHVFSRKHRLVKFNMDCFVVTGE